MEYMNNNIKKSYTSKPASGVLVFTSNDKLKPNLNLNVSKIRWRGNTTAGFNHYQSTNAYFNLSAHYGKSPGYVVDHSDFITNSLLISSF